MAVTQSLNSFVADEAFEIDVFLEEAAGTPEPDAATTAVYIVFAATAGGAAIGDPLEFTLLDAPTAHYRRTVDPDDISGLTEGASYFYNIWSKASGSEASLRAKGHLLLGESIELVLP